MKRPERILLHGSGAIMELSWLVAWTAFSLLSLGGVSIPVYYTTGFFIFGALTSRLIRGKGLRVATVGIVRIAAMAVCLAITLHFLSASQRAFFDRLWINEFFYAPHSATQWLGLFIAAFFTFAAWLGGAFFALRPATHEKVSSRFDVGLTAFLCLAFAGFARELKTGSAAWSNLTLILACFFIFFGLLAIGITRAHGPRGTNPVSGRRKIGIIMCFISAVFFPVVSLAVFLRQPLSQAAGLGYNIFLKAGSSVGSLFLKCIRFLYMPRQVRIKEPPSGSTGSILDHVSSSAGGPWVETAGRIFAWLFGSLMGIIILIIIAICIVLTVRWLLSRTPRDAVRRPFHAFRFGGRLAVFARGLNFFRRARTATDLYRGLKVWSRISGIRQGHSETPLEFSCRVKRAFPSISREIDSLVHAFNREFYGGETLGGEEFARVRSHWRRIKSPGLWAARLKTLVNGPVNPLP